MLEPLRDLQAALRNLAHRLRKARGAQVESKITRGEAKNIVDRYFRTCRSALMQIGVHEGDLMNCDGLFHSLLEASHHRTSVKRYRSTLKALDTELIEIEKRALLTGATPSTLPNIHETD